MQYVYLVVRLGQADLRGRACTEAEWAVGKEPGQICPEVPAFLKIKYVCLPATFYCFLESEKLEKNTWSSWVSGSSGWA